MLFAPESQLAPENEPAEILFRQIRRRVMPPSNLNRIC